MLSSRSFILALLIFGSSTFALNAQAYSFLFQNPRLPIDQRVNDLVSHLTLDEKIAQMNDVAPAIPRLGVPIYYWHTEGAHGAWAWGEETKTTVYPQVIGLAASWNPKLVHQVATATSDEARAVFNEDYRNSAQGGGNGLSIFAPNINIFRDPRWGRGQETYGEDPVLTSRLSVEFIKGLQGNDPRYLKVAATAKHFAVYSGPEEKLFRSNVNPTEKDLHETYLPAFETAIREGHASSVMCAYGSVDGAPSCANEKLLGGILRKGWGFNGPIVSDCGAIHYISSTHKYAKDDITGAVKAVKAGTDLNCQGSTPVKDFSYLKQARAMGLISDQEIDRSVHRLFLQRFKLGLFDPATMVPYANLPFSMVDSEAHRKLARKAALESMVLLKNKMHALPLSRNLRQISVIGPNAVGLSMDPKKRKINVLLGTYHGTPSKYVTPLAGLTQKLKEISPQTKIVYNNGRGHVAEAVKGSDVAILFLGLRPIDDDKDGDFSNGEGEGRDRERIELTADQEAMMQQVHASGVPMIVVFLNGSAVASVYAKQNANAILEAWYPGEEGGGAIADVLFGDYNPAGRLPITFYRSTHDLPAFDNYKMEGRTYRYFRGKPLFPFGFGLSYTQFQYSNLKLSSTRLVPGEKLTVSVDVQNMGTTPSEDGDEVVQLYLNGSPTQLKQPIRSLKAFERIHLKSGERKTVQFTLDASQLSLVSKSGVLNEMPGTYSLSVGGQQPQTLPAQRNLKNVQTSRL